VSSLKDIQQFLDAGHSKELRDQIINYIGSSKAKMKSLMHFFFHDEWRYNQRASWAVLHIGLKNPQLLTPYLEQMVNQLKEPKHDAVVRNTMRIFEDIDVPEDLEGPLLDIALVFMSDPKQAVAIRAFSMTVVENIVKRFPEIAPEIIAILQDQLEYECTPGFKSRAKRTLKSLNKLVGEGYGL